MKLYTLTDLQAAHDIDEGLEYLKSNEFSSTRYSLGRVIDNISAGLATGAALANFPASQGSRNVEKIRFKNNSLCILCPEFSYTRANPNGQANFSRTPGILFPGDEGEFEFSYIPTAYGINNGNGSFHITFLVISADPNFTGISDLPDKNEIPVLQINFYSNRFSKLFIMDIKVNDEVLAPAYDFFLDQRGVDNVMTYFTYRGTQNSKEPSFGLSYFDVRAATVNERNATGTTSLIFTPSAKRSSDPIKNLSASGSAISGEHAVRNLLRVCSFKYRRDTLVQTKSLSFFTTLIGMLSSAKDIYSSISTRTDSRTYLTVNMRNLTGKNMFIVRRKHSNSMRMDNGIVMDGETCVIPLSFSSFRPAEPEILIRIPHNNGDTINLIITFTDYGSGRSIKVSRVEQVGQGTHKDPDTNSSNEGARNCVFSFITLSGNQRILVQPTIVTSQQSPTIDITIVLIENRKEFNPFLNPPSTMDSIIPDTDSPLPE